MVGRKPAGDSEVEAWFKATPCGCCQVAQLLHWQHEEEISPGLDATPQHGVKVAGPSAAPASGLSTLAAAENAGNAHFPRRSAGGVSHSPVGALEATFPLSTRLASHGLAIGPGRVAPACWWPRGPSLTDRLFSRGSFLGREERHVMPIGHAFKGQRKALGRSELSERRVGDVSLKCEA